MDSVQHRYAHNVCWSKGNGWTSGAPAMQSSNLSGTCPGRRPWSARATRRVRRPAHGANKRFSTCIRAVSFWSGTVRGKVGQLNHHFMRPITLQYTPRIMLGTIARNPWRTQQIEGQQVMTGCAAATLQALTGYGMPKHRLRPEAGAHVRPRRAGCGRSAIARPQPRPPPAAGSAQLQGFP